MAFKRNRFQWSSFVLAGVMIIAGSEAAACNIFVDGALGDDVVATGGAGDPFKTIQRGADAALTPGDIVCVRPGVYFENNQDAPSADFKGVKIRASGGVGNPIVFQPDPAVVGRVVIDMEFDVSNAPGSVTAVKDTVGFYIRAFDDITITGFEIRNVTTGILTQVLNSPDPVTGQYDPPERIIIEKNHIHDVRRDQRETNTDTNIAAIRPNDCYDCVIRGNRLHGVSLITTLDVTNSNHDYEVANFEVIDDPAGDDIVIETLINQNSAGIHSFGMLRTVIENNEIFDAAVGVFQKSWTNQPLPGDLDYPIATPPAVNTATDFGLRVKRNLIHDTVLGVRLTPSGGSGRIVSGSGEAHGNPAHYNADISENIFYSTQAAAGANHRLGPRFERMEWALDTDLRGTVDQSERLTFSNNTVIAHNGVNIDAMSDIQIYNNFFSLSPVTDSNISGPEIAIQTEYSRIKAITLLNAGTDLNLGTPSVPVVVTGVNGCEGAVTCDCELNTGLDVGFTDNGGASPVVTRQFSPDPQFFCDENVQWTAEITVSDFNYYHVGKNFRLNRFGAAGNGVQIGGIEQLQTSLTAWQGLTAAGNFGLTDDLPDNNSQADIAPDDNFLSGVTINQSGGVTVDPSSATPFLHPVALDGVGRVGGLIGGGAINIGAFPAGTFNPLGGPFDPATDSGFIGTPRFVAAPGGFTVE